ncbi:MAG TPA: PAS domain-containing protein [Roseiflexaceae bacterium]|nr:PAS domain-containing protein [Roseiflexaceae bacterium]
MSAPLPRHEAARLTEVQRYLPCAADPLLDDLARLAAAICGTPIGLVSLVDADRQRFVANIGMPMSETPREIAFCAHAITQTDLMVVSDTLADARFVHNPLVTGDVGARFYAGAPLTTPSGHALGTLCVIDRIPRGLSAEQQEALRMLGRQALGLMELRRRNAELERATRVDQPLQRRDLAEAVIDTVNSLVVVLDAGGVIESVNHACERALGYTAEELRGYRFWDLLPVEEAAGMLDTMSNLSERSFPVATENIWMTKDRQRRIVTWLTSALRDDSGEIVYLVATGTDVTEQRRAEDELRARETQLRTVLSSAPLVIYTLDRAGVFTFAEGSGLATLGATPASLMGYPIEQIYQQMPETLAHLRATLAGEERFWLNEVSGRVFENRATPLYDAQQQPAGVIGVSQDVTERARSEAERVLLQEQVIAAQAAALAELSTPLIPISEAVVVMPLIGAMDSLRAQRVIATLLNGVSEQHAQAAILDITGVPVVDTQVANVLLQAAQAATLLGTRVILTGIRPEIAQTLVGLGVDLSRVCTCGTLQAGIRLAMEGRSTAGVPARRR